MTDALRNLLRDLRPSAEAPVVFLTGAGFSVASGIPTFRGEEGYWTIGSTVYQPQELATRRAYQAMPREVWQWYLYRKAICNAAEPNAAHRALAELEAALGDAFVLITQNVDGLHRRAGNSDARMCEVHGNIDLMRNEWTGERAAIPDALARKDKADRLTDEEWALLHQPSGTRYRPHILWFDEYYQERLHRSETALAAARRSSLFVVVGTSGAASLPWHAAELALRNGSRLVDINPEENPFRELAEASPVGAALSTGAIEGVRAVCNILLGH